MSLPAVECTFCGASPRVAKVVIEVPPSARARGIFICDECVGVCVEIVAGSAPAALPEIAKAPLRMIARDLQHASRALGSFSELFKAWCETKRIAANISAIADAIGPPELDRAVQGEIARAFGELIQAMVDGEQSFNMWWTDEIASLHRDQIHQDAIRKVATILHTAMGGRIPDEVPHD